MRLLILINCLCSVSIILACLFALARTRFEPEILKYFSAFQIKTMSLILTAICYFLILMNISNWDNCGNLPVDVKIYFLLYTIGYIIVNMAIWKVIYHHLKLQNYDRKTQKTQKTNRNTRVESV